MANFSSLIPHPSSLSQTPSQTVGPFFYDGLIAEAHAPTPTLVKAGVRGQRIAITGMVLDGDHAPVPDAMIEIWQADASGTFNHPADPKHANADPHFIGFGRSDTRDEGRFKFETVKPGSVQGQAPHINVRVFSRGMLVHAITRLYFGDEAANDHDPVLALVPSERRNTLLAHLQTSNGLPTYQFNIVLQGEGETVFFTP
jgi:protocatechuate 3,4-dioxygenase, alpha subunit